MTTEAAGIDETRIRIMHGGLFYDLMSNLGLRARKLRALTLGAASWLVPLLFSLASGDAVFFVGDWGAWAKFLLAPILFTLTEHPIGYAIDECVSALFKTPLIAKQSMAAAEIARADAKTCSTAMLPEAVCLFLGAAASALNFGRFHAGFAPDWAVAQGSLTLAGIWCVVFSNTLYWFLLTRLVWKHVVWTRFLTRIARCRLRLAVTHPDGHGGLGLLGLYPAGYGLFTLAVSSVAAAGISHVMERESVTPMLYTVVCGGWLVIVLFYFALPLAGLAIQLGRLKQRALLLSMAKATDFERRYERSLLGENILTDEDETDTVEFHDVKPIYQASLKTSALIINKGNALPALIPALLPLLVVGASYLSYSQLGPIVKRLLFL